MENNSKPSIAPEILLQNSPCSWSNKGFKYLGITAYPKVDTIFYSSSKMLFNTVQQSWTDGTNSTEKNKPKQFSKISFLFHFLCIKLPNSFLHTY